MATLLEKFNRPITQRYQTDEVIKTARFWQSGAFVGDARLRQLLSGGSPTFEIPHINPIDGNLEANYGNTILSDLVLPREISAYATSGRAAYLNDSFVESSLQNYITQVNTNQLIAGMLDRYWATQADNRAIATLAGIRKAAGADSLTMDISKATATETTKFSAGAFVEAEGEMDEMFQGSGVMVVHPDVATQLRLMQVTEKVSRSDDMPPITMYNGREVVTSRKGTKIAGATPKYITYLMGRGSFAAELVRTRDDLELERTAGTGNGAGHTTLYTRANAIIHPQGFSFIAEAADLNGGTEREAISADWDDLQKGANWRLDADAENLGIRFLVTN